MYSEDAHLTGAYNELRAQTYFTKRGWDVFSPIHNKTRADFVAVMGREVLRVQVKTAQYNNGYIQARVSVLDKLYTKEEVDIVVFLIDNRMWIVPIEEIEGYTSINLGKVDQTKYTPRKEYNPDVWEIKDFH